ncbi:MAG TPA: glycosyltransferase family 1 protein [Terrimicrobiaceae bacterium]
MSISEQIRLVIDAHGLGSRVGGNETYTRTLVDALASSNETDVVCYVHRDESVGRLPATMRALRSTDPIIRNFVEIPVRARLDRAEVLHCQYFLPPFCGRTAVMVHDISFEEHPEWFARRDLFLLKTWVPISVRHASVVLTVSDFCKNRIVDIYQVPPERIHVTPNALPPDYGRYVSRDEGLQAARQFGITKPYLACVGNLQPRKNIDGLIAAWIQLRRRRRDLDLQLAVVGRKAWMFHPIFEKAKDSEFRGDIIFTDYVSANSLPFLYAGAEIMVYPSLYEGFGLPPLESMACGTPVVTGEHTGLREVCADAVHYADVRSTEALSEAIERLLDDRSRRSALSKRGRVHCREFTLEKLRDTTLAAVKAAVS